MRVHWIRTHDLRVHFSIAIRRSLPSRPIRFVVTADSPSFVSSYPFSYSFFGLLKGKNFTSIWDWFAFVFSLPNLIKMSQVRVFSLIGDSNVQRNMNSTNCRDRPLMSEAQVIPCGRLSLLAESLRQVRENSNVVVLACVSNFITSSDGTISSVTNHVEPILREF